MDETQWLGCTDHPYPMLQYLDDRASDRKLTLFSVACLRRIWDLLTDHRSRELVDAAERMADDMRSEETRRTFDATWDAFWRAYEDDELQDGSGEAVEDVARRGAGAAMSVARHTAEAVGRAAAAAIASTTPGEWPEGRTIAWEAAEAVERRVQATLLHDIIGNPFRPPAFDPAWRTPRVVTLAHVVYDQRNFERMPELAQALEEAGCADTAILEHCRRPGSHTRGCWVLDGLLGADDGMTEEEWRASSDLELMWWALRPKPNLRKRQLFAAACCRRIWHVLIDERCRRAVEVLELLADGMAMVDEWNDARHAAEQVARDAVSREIRDLAAAAVEAADCSCGPTLTSRHAAEASGSTEEPAAQASLLREVLGNPFRPVTVNPAWRTSIVTGLARAAYEDRCLPSGVLNPDRLAILADALEEAGCDNAELLSHCRRSEPHVAGCWVVDALLETSLPPAGNRGVGMTPDEWDASTDADRMLYSIGLNASKRKLRLFACACCRRVWNHMRDTRSRQGVEAAERYADGLIGAAELERAREGAGDAFNAVGYDDWALSMGARAACAVCLDNEQHCLRARYETRNVALWSVILDPASQAVEEERGALHLNGQGPLYYAPEQEQAVASEVVSQASLLRDIFGNPFRPAPVIDPSWLSPRLLALAQSIYDELAFDRMPELSVALAEAGCADAAILEHLRGPGPHCRGCHVIDAILDRD
jgi:hypothetical protein